MLPVPFEVVPSAVNALLPAFLQALKGGGECLYQNTYELHRRSCLRGLKSRTLQMYFYVHPLSVKF
jgi:hypothetical protein